MPQLENRTAVLARPETTYGVDSIAPALGGSPSPYQTDALSVSELDLKVTTEQLERPNYSPSLSKDTTGVGRMLMSLTFKAELKASGTLGVAPRIGRLLKGCGMQETIVAGTAAATIGNPVAGPSNASAPAATITSGVTKTTAPTQMYDTYRITCTTGGEPATAKFIVTGVGFPENDGRLLNSLTHTYNSDTAAGTIAVAGTVVAPTFTFAGTWVKDEFVELFVGGIRFYYQVQASDTPTIIAAAFQTLLLADGRFTGTLAATGVLTVALTTGTTTSGTGDFVSSATAQSVNLGNSGAVISIPVWTGSLVAGEYWDIPLIRPGVRYDPVSDNFSSLTFYVYLDGTLVKLTGARGTFSIEGQAARYPMVSFTFTGIYDDPIDAALPASLSFENSKPWKVELAQLALYGLGQNPCASRFAFDMANTVEAKDCINASEAYDEVRITARAPTAGADPESNKPSLGSPWLRMRREDTTRFHVAVGRRGGVGNIVRIQADKANIRDAPFTTRTNIRAYDVQLALARVTGAGNDEVSLQFS